MKFKMGRVKRFLKDYLVFGIVILVIALVIVLSGDFPSAFAHLLMLTAFSLVLYFSMPGSFTVEQGSLRVSIPVKPDSSNNRGRKKSSLMVVKVKFYELHKVVYSYRKDDDMTNIGNIELVGRYVLESVNGNSESEYTLGVIMPDETILYSVKDLRGAINAITRAFPDAQIQRENNLK